MQNLNIIEWFDKSTIKHLRLMFSFYLMPVFLFALSQANQINWLNTVLAFVILHLLVFPSSNGYNSFQDRDETSIGGLRYPPKVNGNLYVVTLLFDILAVLSSLLISVIFTLLILMFIITSRAYSYRKIRLKKYPVIGFLTVFFFQGGFIFWLSTVAISGPINNSFFTVNNMICMAIASLFIGSMYPLTQIYQHESDKNDGVISISYKLGYNGTFVFSGLLFTIANVLLFYYFNLNHEPLAMFLFILFMIPVIIRLLRWAKQVRNDYSMANYDNTMTINNLTSICMNLYFMLLIANGLFKFF